MRQAEDARDPTCVRKRGGRCIWNPRSAKVPAEPRPLVGGGGGLVDGTKALIVIQRTVTVCCLVLSSGVN